MHESEEGEPEPDEVKTLLTRLMQHPAGDGELLRLRAAELRYGVNLRDVNALRYRLAQLDVAQAERLAGDGRDEVKRAAAMARAEAVPSPPSPSLPGLGSATVPPHGPIVYYMELGTRIKIGTSTNLRLRFDALNAERLLAIEPGGIRVEDARHRQFAQWRTHGEWFIGSPVLRSHIKLMRRQFEHTTGVTLDAWFGARTVRSSLRRRRGLAASAEKSDPQPPLFAVD